MLKQRAPSLLASAPHGTGSGRQNCINRMQMQAGGGSPARTLSAEDLSTCKFSFSLAPLLQPRENHTESLIYIAQLLELSHLLTQEELQQSPAVHIQQDLNQAILAASVNTDWTQHIALRVLECWLPGHAPALVVLKCTVRVLA